jgi:hypothetical protein
MAQAPRAKDRDLDGKGDRDKRAIDDRRAPDEAQREIVVT